MEAPHPFFCRYSRSFASVALSLAFVFELAASSAMAAGAVVDFDKAYKSAKASTDSSELELQQEAGKASQAKNYTEACAKYLAAAAHAFHLGNFERARPAFDKAFLMATHLTSDEKKQMLQNVSTIISDSRIDRDLDTFKYFAQQRLKLLQRMPESTADERYNEVQTLAFSCSQHKRFKEAESLLLETLKDLESMNPIPENYGYCASTLARIFNEAGDNAMANKYYGLALKFARQDTESNSYEHILSSYLDFLLDSKMFKEASPIADEYYEYATAPVHSNYRDQGSFAGIARKFSESNLDQSDKYYRAALENQVRGTKISMNTGYGQTCAEWAAMLHKFGKATEAVALLERGMAFCRTVEWPRSFNDNMPVMVELCEKYLRESHRDAEADELRSSYGAEKIERGQGVRTERRTWLTRAAGDSSQRPADRIEALTELSYSAFAEENCAEGLKLLKDAVEEYEKNIAKSSSERIYSYFYNINARLKKCGKEEESRPLLLRIIRARMVDGFADPEERGYHHSHSFDRLDAFNDYLSLSGLDRKRAQDELLSEAKASGKASNVIFVLRHVDALSPFSEARLTRLEEIAKWAAKENNPSHFYSIMLEIASWNIEFDHFDKAAAKWKQTIGIAEKERGKTPNYKVYYLSAPLQNLGRAFIVKKQLVKANEVYVVAYKLAMESPSEYQAQMVANEIEALAAKYHELGDAASGEVLLNHVLALSRAKRGVDSLLERMCLIKLADFYATCGDHAKAKNTCTAFLASVNKPGLSVSRTTMDDMEKHVRVLKKVGLSTEATLVEKKLIALEAKQCVMSDGEGHKH
jgi:hypothetical protein